LIKNKDCADVIEQQPGINTFLVKYINNFENDAELANQSNIIMQHLKELKAIKMQRHFPPNAMGFDQWNAQPAMNNTYPPNDMYRDPVFPQMYGQDNSIQQSQINSFNQQQQPNIGYDGFTAL